MSAREELAHTLWKSMIYRSFARDLPKDERRMSAVSAVWKEFSKFYAWFVQQPCSELSQVFLNKDLLFPGNNVYGPSGCVLLPKEIHELLSEARITRSDFEAISDEYVGRHGQAVENAVADAYEVARAIMEDKIRTAAIKYKDVLDERAYRKLMLYRVEIVD
jgi:hypothetical protein